MKFLLLFSMLFTMLFAFTPMVCADEGSTPIAIDAEKDFPAPAPIEEGKVYGFKEMIDFAIVFVKNVKFMSPMTISMYVMVLLLMILNSSLCCGWFGKKSPLIKRLIIFSLGEAFSVMLLIQGGIAWYYALWGGFILAGGAQLFFENVVSVVPELGKYLKYVIQLLGFFRKK